ncbi:AIPR family protein [Microbacterium sp. zg.B48]|uniref:AIPR family protein n=1 Tax=Microbacterium sp. zg.B48 TaxID=2969408 RepID=UPI00214AE520|nr:AIPR family protein [Microbacterium sp. zg.B48]MCR2763811.1 AIPR family protein [Microbacterium sp. zg.B48]
MDRITTSYVETFRTEQSLPVGDVATTFEHFANYCILSDSYDEEFSVPDVHTGGGSDLTLDGVAILVNGVLVTEIDEIEELLRTNGFLDVRFVFIQAKTASGFSGEEIASFGDGVLEFFAEEPVLPMSDRIVHLRELMAWIYDHSVQFKHEKPTCELSFVTTGKWVDDQHLLGKIMRAEAKLADTNLFSRVALKPFGATEIQASWTRSKNAASVEFTFANKVTVPDIPGVTESYVGVLPLNEFLRVVSDPESGSIRKHIFYDNVRDFQGDNPVNSEIARSLGTVEGRDRFAVLNNGVTLVARSLRNTGNKFFVSDYQIVNGCQTSHVLHNSREELPDSLGVPFKVIATNDEEVINSIITATNRQTQVTDDDLYALSTFQKQLEAYMGAFDERHRLHYERRSKQYNTASVEKVRIVTKTLEMRSFAAMFLDEPRRAANYYSELKPQVGKTIFSPTHKIEPYYTAAFAYYKLEFFFRNGQIPVSFKPARFHILMVARYLAAGSEMPAFTANKIEGYAKKVNDVLWDDQNAVDLFKAACAVIDSVQEGVPLTRESVKPQSFTDAVLKVVKAR